MTRVWMAALGTLIATSTANAQLPGISVNVGVAVPVRNEADFYNNGVHIGAALKLPILPVQIEAAWDRMGGNDDGSDLTILSGSAVIPIGLTPPLVPVSVYALAGGGIYNADAVQTSTDAGVTAGAGVRLRLPGFSPFAEGRGVLIFGEGNKFTYLTASVGLHF